MSSENYIIRDQYAVHFLTFTVIDWIDVFTRASYKIEIANALEYCQMNKGLRLFAWCLMTNHLHLVCQTDEPFKLSEFVRDFKKYTAKVILKCIWDEPESRRGWILNAFRIAGKYDNRITTENLTASEGPVRVRVKKRKRLLVRRPADLTSWYLSGVVS